MYIFLLPLAVVILLALPVISRIKHFTDGTKCKNAITGNICSFFGVMPVSYTHLTLPTILLV